MTGQVFGYAVTIGRVFTVSQALRWKTYSISPKIILKAHNSFLISITALHRKSYKPASVLSTTTTKDDGGTGVENYVKYKGVRTAAGSETVDGAELVLYVTLGPDEFATSYATGTLSQALVVSDVYTVNWTITVN